MPIKLRDAVILLERFTSCNAQTYRTSINITDGNPKGRSYIEVRFTSCCPPIIDELRICNKYIHSSLEPR